ncbi:MAG: hypothetical protein NTW87_09615 [Planctomycetota bacterium]|nr:hypothetical protein [Planctomycetota bacterium]
MTNDPIEAEALRKAKEDGPFLWKVLGVTKNGNHETCPLCKKRNLSVQVNERGEYYFNCKGGCGGGSVVDAIRLVEKKDLKAALNEAKAPYRPAQSPYSRFTHAPVNPQASAGPDDVRYGTARPEPKLDMDKAQAFVDKAHKHLMGDLGLLDMWHRGISADVVKQYTLGFIEDEPMRWAPWLPEHRLPAAWVLPVTDPTGKALKGVKIHFEVRPKDNRGEPWGAKALWLPFGTEPAYDEAKNVKPHNAYYGLWPHPDTLVRPMPEVNVDVNWWVARIPKGHPLEKRLNDAKELSLHCIAQDQKMTVDQLSDDDCGLALDQAFATLRGEIVRLVTKGENAAPEEEEDVEKPDWEEYVFVHAGELKALAWRSVGLMATSVTSGESWIPPPNVLACFAACKMVIFYDDDPPTLNTRGEVRCPGAEYARRLNRALLRAGATETIVINGGRTNASAK